MSSSSRFSGLYKAIVLISLVVCSISVYSQNHVSSRAPIPVKHKIAVPNEDISAGVVIDQTATFLGQNFYHEFVQTWSDLDTKERFTITVKERPTARYGSFLTVEFRGLVIFNTQLSPISAGSIKTMAKAAALRVFNTVNAIEAEKLVDPDIDLGGDEL